MSLDLVISLAYLLNHPLMPLVVGIFGLMVMVGVARGALSKHDDKRVPEWQRIQRKNGK